MILFLDVCFPFFFFLFQVRFTVYKTRVRANYFSLGGSLLEGGKTGPLSDLDADVKTELLTQVVSGEHENIPDVSSVKKDKKDKKEKKKSKRRRVDDEDELGGISNEKKSSEHKKKSKKKKSKISLE